MQWTEAVEDVVRKLGLLSLGTRLKRIGERLQADTQEIIDRFGLPVAAGQFPYLAALDRLGPLGIGELSLALGVAQPGVTRTVGQLARIGLVEVASAEGDQRRRIVTLSKRGRALVESSKTALWPRIDAAVADLCGDDAPSLLSLLDALEDGLERSSLARRSDGAERSS